MKCPEVIQISEEVRIKYVHIQLLLIEECFSFPQFIAFQCHIHCHFCDRNFWKETDITPNSSLPLPMRRLLGFYCIVVAVAVVALETEQSP